MIAAVRTCIACGRKGARSEFWRFKAKAGEAPGFDQHNQGSGRGASVCQSAMCVEKAIARRCFERALKLKEPLPSGFKLQLRQLNGGSGT